MSNPIARGPKSRFDTMFELLLPLLLVALLLGIVNSGTTFFEHEGNSLDILLQSLTPENSQGRQTYFFDFGRLSPDEGVEFSFYTTFVSEVTVKNSYGTVIYHESRNGGFYARVFPDRSANATLEITPLCTNCGFESYDRLSYTYYTRFPYYEVKILLDGLIAALALIWIAYFFRNSHPVKRIRWLIALFGPPVGLFMLSWYWYAFGYEQWFIAAVFAAVAVILEIVFAFVIPQIMKEALKSSNSPKGWEQS
jgi:hypothetical protein